MFDYLKPSPFLRDTSLLTLLEAATWLQTSTEVQIMQCISKIGEICLGNWKQPQPTDMCVDCLWILLKKQLCNWDVTFIGGVLDLWFATLAAYSNHLGSFWHYRGWTPPSDVCFHCSVKYILHLIFLLFMDIFKASGLGLLWTMMPLAILCIYPGLYNTYFY